MFFAVVANVAISRVKVHLVKPTVCMFFSGQGPTNFLADFREALLSSTGFREALLDYTWYSEETNKTREFALLVLI